MHGVYSLLVAPFVDYAFMQRALFGSLMLSLGACPVGVFLMLRRMSLSGDAMAHAILPGAAAGFLLYGLDILPMRLKAPDTQALDSLFESLNSGVDPIQQIISESN